MSKRELWISMVAGMAGGVLVTLVHGGVALAAPTTPKVVSAEQFALLDASGKVRGVWSLANDVAVLGLDGPDGSRLALAVGAANGSLSYLDKEKRAGFSLTHTESKGPALVLNAESDKSSVGLGVVSGQPLVYLQDGNANVRASMTLVKGAQTAMFSMADANRRIRVRIGGDATKGESVFSLWDAEGKPVSSP